jgi:hypothetical protein
MRDHPNQLKSSHEHHVVAQAVGANRAAFTFPLLLLACQAYRAVFVLGEDSTAAPSRIEHQRFTPALQCFTVASSHRVGAQVRTLSVQALAMLRK